VVSPNNFFCRPLLLQEKGARSLILGYIASYKVGLHCVIIGLSFSDAGGRPVPPVANSFSQLF